MNAGELLRHYERVADAPEAVSLLRRFVLELAVRGKLAEQVEADEPAAALVRRIALEKSKASAPVMGKAVSVDLHMAGSGPYELPSSWTWVPLGAVVISHVGGGTPSKSNAAYWGGSIPWASVKDIGKAKYVASTVDSITPEGLAASSSNLVESNNLIVVTRMGLGKLSINAIPMAINQDLRALTLSGLVSIDFVYNFFRTHQYEGSGLTVKGIRVEELLRTWLPLPPLAEQHRIVAKVEELMALCDRLEAARAEREAARDRLAASSLARLNTPDSETFRQDARFALDALPALTARADLIQQTRQTILGVAMAGKLVSQESVDESASTLLSRKAALPIGYQRRRKILKESTVDAPQALFPVLPSSWAYADVQSLYDLNVIVDYADGNHGALYPRSSEFADEGVLFVTAKDLTDGRVAWSSCAKLNESRAKQLPKGWALGGDVLLTHNATVGRVARVERDAGPFLLGTSVTFYRLNPEVLNPDFFYYFLQSPIWQGQLAAIMAQTTRNQVSIQKQAFFRVVVPPPAEQRRIVAKVEDLMAVCNRLEASLSSTDDLRRRLLDVLLHEALDPTEQLEEAA